MRNTNHYITVKPVKNKELELDSCLTSNGTCQLKLASYPYANVKCDASNYQKHGDTTVGIKLMLKKQGGARQYALYLVIWQSL